MAVLRRRVFLVVLNFVWAFTRADTELSCIFMKSCILPCSFQPGSQVVIHWIQLAGELPVHSYYYEKDQLDHQDARFRKRTSLFKAEISRGIASLQLTDVQPQDQGRYKCYTSTITGNKEAFINLKVDAPVTEVHMEQVENRISCSSQGIYPQPELTWSTKPPSSRTFNATTTVQPTEQLLYSISSSVILSQGDTDVVHSCTISTRPDRRSTTLFKPTHITGSSTETIHCGASEPPITNFIWRFNHSQVIVNHSSVSDEWRPYVKSVTDAGSLTLQQLSSSQNGVYTCEFSNAEKRSVIGTFLEFREDSSKTSIIVGAVVGVLLTLVAVGFILYVLKKKKKKKNKRRKEENNGSLEMRLTNKGTETS